MASPNMAFPNVDQFRTQLLERRAKLEEASVSAAASRELGRLMSEVDAALARIEQGTYGLCHECHDPIEIDGLMREPLITLCLDHLTAAQRRDLEEDLTLAVRVQSQLLPQPGLTCAGWETYYRYLPAGAVSGDFCDLIRCEGRPERLFFVVGDVAGKGVAASLLMTHLNAILRTLVPMGMPLTDMVRHANKIFCENTMTAHYATVLCGYASASGEIEMCSAGHCPPLVSRRGQMGPLEVSGLPLGLFCQGGYDSTHLELESGDSVLIYTDGVTEARDRFDFDYGSERLREVFGRFRGAGAEALVSGCLDHLKDYLGGVPRHDDVTLLAIRRQ
jgi:phosphoserine phosphatase RsbU/P